MSDTADILQENREQIRVSVRGLVEFILRSGDIDNRSHQTSADAMLEGGRIHRMIQRRMGGGYRAEVPLVYTSVEDGYDIVIDGRADGIFDDAEDGCTFIDEIKGVYRDLKRMKEPVRIHLAQAKCYGAIWTMQHDLEKIGIQMTYCNMDTEDIKRFKSVYSAQEILEWFADLVAEYRKWADFRYKWKKTRQASIKALDFPFEYREGQKDLAAAVYRTIYHERRLFLEAPTGVGKTISTLFPAIKALGEGHGDMIFYLTAKTLTGTVAHNTYDILAGSGLRMKTVFITAKEKMCPLDEMECNPDLCPYAKGHYDRINNAVFELLTEKDNFTRETIREYADKHQVCPFEFCLDMSLFSDGVICDYNYVFDPNVYLRRFFSEGAKGDYIFLVDEAHNLVDRAREMYSATLSKDDFIAARKLIAHFDDKMASAFDSCNRILLRYMRESGDAVVRASIDDFLIVLTRAAALMDEFLEEDEGSSVRRELLDFYFEVRHFLNMADIMGDDYVIYTQMIENGNFIVRLFCVDPSRNLRNCLDRGVSTIFFSATLLPVTYYMDLLSGDRGDYSVYAKSSFDPAKRGVFIAGDVSSKYTRRGPREYSKIAEYIYRIVCEKTGNYMVFFPSYRFMEDVYNCWPEDLEDMEVICQEPSMTEQQREAFLARFMSLDGAGDRGKIVAEASLDFDIQEENGSLIGFCVMGGIFSEGIDLQRDSLIGAIIVGTGLPQVGPQLEILKDYFDGGRERSGFDYAYRIPGMNKVLQSAGRVIRTSEDRGVVILLDDRFMSVDYRAMFPREWENILYGDMERIIGEVRRFWEQE